MSGGHKPRLDKELGEDRSIPRRDFLQGTLIDAATALDSSLLAGCVAEAAEPTVALAAACSC
ncbi:MAG TPA: hypothetical protein VGD47_06335 [Steroidobacteraceae bacterium]